MMRTFIVSGERYHQGKVDFKTLMKTKGLKWVGSFTAPKWASDNIKVAARFIRDQEKGITVESQFEVSGEGTDYEEICEYIAVQLGGVEGGAEDIGIKKAEITDKLYFFDMVHKPNIELLKWKGAPDSFIRHELEWYEERRKKFIEELEKEKSGE